MTDISTEDWIHEDRLKVFCKFSTAHVSSKDIDPAYPMLKDVYDKLGLSLDDRVWRTVLYVTFYSLGSAEIAWERYPTAPDRVEPFALPTGVERRGMRGQPDRVAGHLNCVLDAAQSCGGIGRWAENQAREGGTRGWDDTRQEFESLEQCGPWASYKWADLMKHTLGFEIEASDIGVGGRGKKAGPIPGMVWLTGMDWKQCAHDVGRQKQLLEICRDKGVPFAGLDQLETSLCDVNSMIKGRYYVGHDIDLMMTQLQTATPMFWESRSRVFEPQWLGEKRGWFGSRHELESLYKTRGKVFTGS